MERQQKRQKTPYYIGGITVVDEITRQQSDGVGIAEFFRLRSEKISTDNTEDKLSSDGPSTNP